MTTNAIPGPAEMERAFFGKDASYDGVFVTGVKTTGIFCRPSCTARKPLRENLEFFGSVKDALFAGYRPCLRCRPLEADGRPPEWVEQLLAAVDESPDGRLRAPQLRALGITPERARRFFQKTLRPLVRRLLPRTAARPCAHAAARGRGPRRRRLRRGLRVAERLPRGLRPLLRQAPRARPRRRVRMGGLAAHAARADGRRRDRARACACSSSRTGACSRRSSGS